MVLSVCANRRDPDDPARQAGFFSPCSPCKCGQQYAAELAASAIPTTTTDHDTQETP